MILSRPALPRDDLHDILALTPQVWPRLRGSRVFITGGTGFIGTWLLEAIQLANAALAAGVETVVLSRDPAAALQRAPKLFASEGLTLVEGDITRLPTGLGAFDFCIHAATDVGAAVDPLRQRRLFEHIAVGTACVLEACEKVGARRILLASSGAVYGTQPPALAHVDESFAGAPDMLDPNAAYANGKRAAEWLASEHAARTGAGVVIARIFALLGPHLPLHGHLAAGNFVGDAIAGRPLEIKGDGRPLRSYLYIADACVWLLRLLVDGRSGEAYNVGSQAAVSIASLAEAVVEAAGIELPVRVRADAGLDAALPPRYVPCTLKARSEFGLAEYTALAPALLKTVAWSRLAAMQ